MDWNRIEGSWKEFKGKAQTQWGQLTDDDLTSIGGKRDELLGKTASALWLQQGSRPAGNRPLAQ